MEKRKSAALLASAVFGHVALSATAAPANAAEEGAKVKCYGVNKCKGQGACAGAGNSCGGHNACAGKGFVEVESKEACLKMEGGRLTVK